MLIVNISRTFPKVSIVNPCGRTRVLGIKLNQTEPDQVKIVA